MNARKKERNDGWKKRVYGRKSQNERERERVCEEADEQESA